MPCLERIVGQSRVVASLRSQIALGKVHHAFLFEGPVGVGKATCAQALAMALNCAEPLSGGCGECPSCQKIEAGLHPDLIFVDMTPKGLTERVRELRSTFGFTPHEGRARVVVLDPAEALAGQQKEAANVLLKTLEEPPANTYFVLVTAQPERLPITIRSRCQRVRFAPLDTDAIEKLLVAQGQSAADARTYAQASQGSLTHALRASSPEGAETKALMLALIKAAEHADAIHLTDAAAEVGADRDRAAEVLELLLAELRDALIVREGLGHNRLSPARISEARKLADALGKSSAGILGMVDATREALESLKGNVAPALTLEHLLFRMVHGGRIPFGRTLERRIPR